MLETKKKGKRCERRGRRGDETIGTVAPHASSPVHVLHRSSWRYTCLAVFVCVFGVVFPGQSPVTVRVLEMDSSRGLDG